MARKIFPTPEDAEAAFYDAFERCDLAAMLAVWASEDNIICIHPQGPRLTGMEAIRASWAEIFAGGPNFKLKVSEARMHHGQTLAVRTVYETMVVPGAQQSAPVFATNVYLLTPGGWRIIMHHASSSPPGTTAEEQGVARILH